ncbi:clostripain-related cysteine peptidase [Alistipes sp.]|uniref:clostripain-related cysteine peptidase n=1 Tax=Alistipes sp. TaxID=1872444 RepID=UPI0025BA6CA8|nr:clostripain-related cysteine peptidase [Alistipes sp.]
MSRILRHTLCLALLLTLAACEKEHEPRLAVSTGEIHLPGDASSGATFTVSAEGAWTLSYSGEGFAVTPDGGDRGETTVTVTASGANSARERRKLGTITVSHAARPGGYPVEVYQRPAVATQTLLLYMPGQSLLTYYEQNIEDVSAAVTDRIPGDGRILICYQPEKHTSALLQEIRYDPATNRCQRTTLKTYDDFNAGDPDKVRQLFADAAEAAPARNYGLIIGCHGKAWIPASGGPIPYTSQRPSAEEAWTTVPGAKQTRSFGDKGYELDIMELKAALEAQQFRFDYLIFDDCFMANIETLYDLRSVVGYIVASPCEIMSDGFPYDRIIPHLFETEAVAVRLTKSCREFWNLYQNEYQSTTWKEQSGCISMAVTSQLDALAEVMRRINQAKKQPFELSELQYYKGGRTPLFYDLGHYVALSCGDPALVDEFSRQLDRAFPSDCRLHTARFYSAYGQGRHEVHHYTGVSVSEPSPQYAAENRMTNWYRDTH